MVGRGFRLIALMDSGGVSRKAGPVPSPSSRFRICNSRGTCRDSIPIAAAHGQSNRLFGNHRIDLMRSGSSKTSGHRLTGPCGIFAEADSMRLDIMKPLIWPECVP